MTMNLEPKPGISLSPLADIFWDYDYSFSGKDIYDFVLGKKEIPKLDRDQVRARVLMTTGWYRLIDIFGLKNLKLLLTGDTLKWVWVEDLRGQYERAGRVIDRILS